MLFCLHNLRRFVISAVLNQKKLTTERTMKKEADFIAYRFGFPTLHVWIPVFNASCLFHTD